MTTAVAAVPRALPRQRPLVGHALAFRRDPLDFLTRMAEAHGDVVRYRLGRREVVFLPHPDHVKDVLVTQQHDFGKSIGIEWLKRFLGEGLLTGEGEFHRRQRRLMQPAFHRQRLSTYAGIMVECGRQTRQGWRDGALLDVDAEMMRLTLAAVTRSLFGMGVEAEAGTIGAALTAMMVVFPRFSLPLGQLLDLLPLPSNRRYRQARARLDETVYRIIRTRRAQGGDTGDLLSMLLMAQDDEGDGKRMDDRQLRNEVMTLLLAGYETTANALTWTWYLLSQNPGAEARLHAELDAVLAGRAPTAEDVPQLVYTERVFAESMRLFPPVWGLGRRALRDTAVCGHAIPAGRLLVLSPWVTHHDARWYPDPLVFDPDRWTPEVRAARPRFAYFPFGGGSRTCIGEGFAWMEGVLLIATLAQEWRLRLASGQRVAPQAFVTLRPRHGMKMTAARRAAPQP